MHPNAQLIERFYQAFQQLDGAAMAACYHPEVVFDDPVFIGLRGEEAGDMWKMLCARAKRFSLEFDEVRADEQGGSAHWVATYEFSKTGNMVVNDIRATFEFRDGKIVRHRDVFDLWRWSRQALGLKGVLLGWLPPVQASIRKQARASLEAYRRRA
ncbi:nuclear transport factor 2 family protein [Chitinimonas arctica]|uniref:Nuclear transport factor 2 family protein n=1 Tax=Chitinimonas arctica TaxID=2594795 RepID=A0A516SKA9_9NEIS|nr:nuclear transport factor 2 family protein [Chitinimonas arctica]QDQ28584.1 nuclear transport factor 2 family protein [Chitinimonas arctica]